MEAPTEGASSRCLQRLALGRAGGQAAGRAPRGRCASAGDHAGGAVFAAAAWTELLHQRPALARRQQRRRQRGGDRIAPRHCVGGHCGGRTRPSARPRRAPRQCDRRCRLRAGAARRPRAGRTRSPGRSTATTCGRPCARTRTDPVRASAPVPLPVWRPVCGASRGPSLQAPSNPPSPVTVVARAARPSAACTSAPRVAPSARHRGAP